MAFMYDATGKRSEFQTTETFVIFEANQTIRLKNAAYLEVFGDDGKEATREDGSKYSLVVRTVTRTEDGSLVRSDPIESLGIDGSTRLWQAIPDQDDTQIKSELLLNISTINRSNTICNVLRFNTFYKGEDVLVEVAYQRVRKDAVMEDVPGVDGPRYSPALMQDLIDRVKALEFKPAVAGNMFGSYLGDEDILEEDLTGLAPENFVRYERHDVNTPVGINVLQPAKGAFYPNGLEIIMMNKEAFTLTEETRDLAEGKLFFYSDTEATVSAAYHVSRQRRRILNAANINELLEKFEGAVTGYIVDVTNTEIVRLVEGIDFSVDDIDMTRTARTSSTSAVYRHIRFITEVSGEVLISYRAFGGFVTPKDIRAIHQDVKNTQEILNNTDLLTQDGLQNLPLIIQLIKRLRIIEQYHNHFNSVDHNIYVRGVSGIHWFNIAALYDVDWNMLLTGPHDVGHFRIHSALRDWTYEFMVDVDPRRAPGKELQVKVVACNQSDPNITKAISTAMTRDNILARLCWVDDGERSGCVLQIGWDLSVYNKNGEFRYPIDTDTVNVINKSGSKSFWTLETGTDITDPNDGTVTVYNHHTFKLTADTKFKSGKKYYIFKNRYLYFRTKDAYIKAGRAYFAQQPDGTYADMSDTVTPGTPTTDYGEDDFGATLMERALHGKFVTNVDVTVGADVVDNTFYEVDMHDYSEDTSFVMPNANFMWDATVANCKSCVAPMCPDDGILMWIGSANVSHEVIGASCKACEEGNYAVTAPGSGTHNPYVLYAYPGTDLQSWLNISNIKYLNVVLFDRVAGAFLTCKCETKSIVKTNSGETLTFISIIDPEDQCWMTVQVARNNGIIQLDVSTFLGTFSRVNQRFSVRRITAQF